MRAFRRTMLSIFFVLSMSSHAFANDFSCIGKVLEIGIHQPAMVTLKVEGAPFLILCSLDSTRQAGVLGGLNAVGCKAAQAVLYNAQLTGRPVRIVIDNKPANVASCADLPPSFGAQTRFVHQQ